MKIKGDNPKALTSILNIGQAPTQSHGLIRLKVLVQYAWAILE